MWMIHSFKSFVGVFCPTFKVDLSQEQLVALQITWH